MLAILFQIPALACSIWATVLIYQHIQDPYYLFATFLGYILIFLGSAAKVLLDD